jgi:hypothetical protein
MSAASPQFVKLLSDPHHIPHQIYAYTTHYIPLYPDKMVDATSSISLG